MRVLGTQNGASRTIDDFVGGGVAVVRGGAAAVGAGPCRAGIERGRGGTGAGARRTSTGDTGTEVAAKLGDGAAWSADGDAAMTVTSPSGCDGTAALAIGSVDESTAETMGATPVGAAAAAGARTSGEGAGRGYRVFSAPRRTQVSIAGCSKPRSDRTDDRENGSKHEEPCRRRGPCASRSSAPSGLSRSPIARDRRHSTGGRFGGRGWSRARRR